MTGKKAFGLAAFLASVIAMPLNAQKVLLLPGTGSAVNAFTVDPFSAATPIGGASGALTVIPHPSGNKNFFVTRSNVAIVNDAGNSLETPVSVGMPILAAALTPDGGKLLVAAGTASAGSLYIFNVSGSKASQTGVVTVGANPVSVTASIDSARAFVLTQDGLTSVDLGANNAGGTVSLAGASVFSSRVVLGPNGLPYVNADRTLYEISADGMTVRHAIALNAFPNPPTFTLDGRTALMANPEAGYLSGPTEPGLLAVDLTTYTVTNTATLPGVSFTKLIPTNPAANTLYAVSAQYGGLYQLRPDLSTIGATTFPGVGSIENVLSAFTSTELPNRSGVVGPRYLFVVTQTALYRIDLNPPAGAQIVKSLPYAPPSPGGIYFVPPSANTVVSTLTYGDGQVLALGGTSAPLVVRAVDSLGRPVGGAAVTFTTSSGSIVSAMTATNTEGFAQAIVKAPQMEGTFTVSAALAGNLKANFSITVGNSGGGPGPGTAGLSILTGDGQVIQGGHEESEPLMVRVTGAGGAPVAGAAVKYTVNGSLGGALRGDNCTQIDTATVSCNTDAYGLASAMFKAPSFAGDTAFLQTTVTASVEGFGQVTFNEAWTPATLQTQQILVPTNTATAIKVRAGTTLSNAITAFVYAQSGAPIPNVGLMVLGTVRYDFFQETPAYCSGWIPLSGTDGVVNCNLVVPADTAAGVYQIFAVFGGNTAVPLLLDVTAAEAPTPVPTTVTIISGSPQSGPVGQTLQPLVVVVKDQSGNPMPNTAVSWSVSGPVQLKAPTSSTTGADGRASTGAALGSTTGAATVRVTAGNASATFNLTVTASIGNVTKGSGDGQSVLIGGQFAPVSVKVTDAQNNAVAGVSVEFKVTSGAATPPTQTAVTDASGVAQAAFTATNTPGQIVVTATASGKSVQFSLAARRPGPVLTANSFLNGASMQYAAGVAFGSIVAVKGEGLTTGLTIPAGTCLSAVPDGNLERGLPLELAGIAVQFSSERAPIFAVCKNADGTEQVNVQAPFELAPATITAMVTTGKGTSMEMTTFIDNVKITNASPGIFEYNATNATRAAVALRPDGTVVSSTNKARRGETIRVFATGLGPVLPVGNVPVKTNQPGYPGQMPFFTTSVQVGGSGAAGVTAEYAQNLIGVFIVTFQVPDNAQTGDGVQLVVSVLTDTDNSLASWPSSIPIQ